MRNEPVRLGWLSLLLVVVILTLSVLSVLAFTTAKADLSLANKQALQVDLVYAQEAKGQEWLEAMDAILKADSKAPTGDLPGGAVVDENGNITVTLESDSGQLLDIALAPGESGDYSRYKILRWQHGAKWEEDTSMGSLFGV